MRFTDDETTPVGKLMTSENLATIREPVDHDEAKRMLQARRIEKLLVVDGEDRCIGLLTVKDIEKSTLNPTATKDELGRLRVAAASTVGDAGFERSGADRCGRRPDGDRHRARPFEIGQRGGGADQETVQRRAGRRGQRGHGAKQPRR